MIFALVTPQAIIINCFFKKLFLESSIDRKIEEFQKALYRHQVSNPDTKLYDPSTMKQFADEHSPGLFEDLLRCVTGRRSLSDKRKELQQQRVVSLLHILAYFR